MYWNHMTCHYYSIVLVCLTATSKLSRTQTKSITELNPECKAIGSQASVPWKPFRKALWGQSSILCSIFWRSAQTNWVLSHLHYQQLLLPIPEWKWMSKVYCIRGRLLPPTAKAGYNIRNIFRPLKITRRKSNRLEDKSWLSSTGSVFVAVVYRSSIDLLSVIN